MEEGDKERSVVIIGIRIRIKSWKSMKNELTSALNILVIDKNMYLFPELFFVTFLLLSTLPLTLRSTSNWLLLTIFLQFFPLTPVEGCRLFVKVENKFVATNYLFPNSSL